MQVGFLLGIVVIMAIFALIVAGFYFFHQKVMAVAERALWRCYEGTAISTERLSPLDVRIVFHTYHGLLVGFEQVEHMGFLPPEDALELLRRLNRFNLTWGLLCRGSLLIAVLSPINYLIQRRSVRRQHLRLQGRSPHL